MSPVTPFLSNRASPTVSVLSRPRLLRASALGLLLPRRPHVASAFQRTRRSASATSRSRIRVCWSRGRAWPNRSLDDHLMCILGPTRAFDHAWGSGRAPRCELIAADITPLPRGLTERGRASDRNRAATTTRDPSRLRCRVRRSHVVSGGSDGASMRGSRSEHSTATSSPCTKTALAGVK